MVSIGFPLNNGFHRSYPSIYISLKLNITWSPWWKQLHWISSNNPVKTRWLYHLPFKSYTHFCPSKIEFWNSENLSPYRHHSFIHIWLIWNTAHIACWITGRMCTIANLNWCFICSRYTQWILRNDDRYYRKKPNFNYSFQSGRNRSILMCISTSH